MILERVTGEVTNSKKGTEMPQLAECMVSGGTVTYWNRYTDDKLDLLPGTELPLDERMEEVWYPMAHHNPDGCTPVRFPVLIEGVVGYERLVTVLPRLLPVPINLLYLGKNREILVQGTFTVVRAYPLLSAGKEYRVLKVLYQDDLDPTALVYLLTTNSLSAP